MSGQRDFYGIIHIEPFGMMVHLFGQQGDTRHERPSLIKISKDKSFGNSVSIRHLFQCKKWIPNKTQKEDELQNVSAYV